MLLGTNELKRITVRAAIKKSGGADSVSVMTRRKPLQPTSPVAFLMRIVSEGRAVVSNAVMTQAMFGSDRPGYNRKSKPKAVLGFLLLWAMAASAQVVDDDAALVKFTRKQLDAAIELTKNENTRLEGLHELIRMAGPRLYEGSLIGGDADGERFKLEAEAALAVAACRDVATVGTIHFTAFADGPY